MILWNS